MNLCKPNLFTGVLEDLLTLSVLTKIAMRRCCETMLAQLLSLEASPTATVFSTTASCCNLDQISKQLEYTVQWFCRNG